MVLKPSLHAKNFISAMNIWEFAVVRYSASILKWIKEEISTLDTNTRKLMTQHRALQPKANVKRLYMKEKRGWWQGIN